ncbi:MAG: hypothetical protein IPI85_17290 [Dehalococcoidia bacterium]|nr:hypothetical protein [Dehalococcoidia bacterium]
MRRDFVIIADTRRGSLGPVPRMRAVGIRTIDRADWYGEGEVKVFLDGDIWPDDPHRSRRLRRVPGACGAHFAQYAGSPAGSAQPAQRRGVPDFCASTAGTFQTPIVFRETAG